MSNITRVSADYTRDGLTRAVVGYDYDSGKWTVEIGPVAEPFDARTFTVDTTYQFNSSVDAAKFQRDNGFH